MVPAWFLQCTPHCFGKKTPEKLNPHEPLACYILYKCYWTKDLNGIVNIEHNCDVKYTYEICICVPFPFNNGFEQCMFILHEGIDEIFVLLFCEHDAFALRCYFCLCKRKTLCLIHMSLLTNVFNEYASIVISILFDLKSHPCIFN